MTIVHNDMHTLVSSSYIIACYLGLDFVLCVYLGFFGFVFYVFFHVNLGHFILVLFDFVYSFLHHTQRTHTPHTLTVDSPLPGWCIGLISRSQQPKTNEQTNECLLLL